MTGLINSFYQSFQNSQFKAVTPSLAIDACAVGPGLKLGLPWPWTQGDLPESPDDTEPVLEVQAPRTDRTANFVVWRDLASGSLDPVISTAGAQIAHIYRGTAAGSRKVLLNGSRGVVVAVDDGQGARFWRVITEYNGRLVHGQMCVPARVAPAYLPQLETMLGTWEWG